MEITEAQALNLKKLIILWLFSTIGTTYAANRGVSLIRQSMELPEMPEAVEVNPACFCRN
jgi:hypothetical protein